MIVLTAHFEATPRHTAELVARAQALLPLSRQEEGCISYEFFTDTTNPNHFLFLETWRDRTALDAHFTQPHFRDFIHHLPNLIISQPSIVTYQTDGPQSA